MVYGTTEQQNTSYSLFRFNHIMLVHSICWWMLWMLWVWNCSAKAISSVEGRRRGEIHDGFGWGNATWAWTNRDSINPIARYQNKFPLILSPQERAYIYWPKSSKRWVLKWKGKAKKWQRKSSKWLSHQNCKSSLYVHGIIRVLYTKERAVSRRVSILSSTGSA